MSTTIKANSSHEDFYRELVALLNKHTAKLDPTEMLAIAANMVGKIIAMQDQRVVTDHKAMQIVMSNIEEGNREAVEGMLGVTKGNA